MSFISQTVPFVALPTAIRGRITPHELAVLWVLQSYHPNIWPSVARVAADTGLSKRKVHYVIDALVAKGWLRVVQRVSNERGNQTNIYHVTIWHECQPAPQTTLDTPAEHPENHPVPSAQHAPPSARHAPPLVHDMHPPGAPHAPEEEQRELNQDVSVLSSHVGFAQNACNDWIGQNQRDVQPDTKKPRRTTKPSRPYSPDFDAFWRRYQAIERRASGQSKPRAWEQYRKIVVSVPCEALEGALTAAVRDQAATERRGGFASPFPDCFRWLRDGRYEAHLQTAQQVAQISRPWQDAPDGCPF